jgi:NitT/TauT family transport system permease protein
MECTATKIVGVYPCCQQRVLHFDPSLETSVSFLVVFPVIYTSVLGGVKSVDPNLLAMADLYNVGFFTKVKGLYFPSVFPYLFVGIRTAISLGIKSTIAAEVISQPMGAIGSNMQQFKINFDIEGVFAWVIVIILISYAIDLLLGKIQNRFEDWKEKL